MIKIDLITGFLGAGKTTFLIKYAQHLVQSGLKIGIIANDFGAVNVDMMLIEASIGDLCNLEMIAGDKDKGTYYRRLKTKLIAMKMVGYDCILIEPSGIFNVNDFLDLLYEEPINQWYKLGSIVTIVDVLLARDLSSQSNYFLASQIANAGVIVFSRYQQADYKQINETLNFLNQVLLKHKCNKVLDNIILKDWDLLTDDDFYKIYHSGYDIDHQSTLIKQDHYFNTLYFMNLKFDQFSIIKIIKSIFADSKCGQVYRIKGFFKEDYQWLEINATKNQFDIQPITNGQAIIIIIGENLNGKIIESYLIESA